MKLSLHTILLVGCLGLSVLFTQPAWQVLTTSLPPGEVHGAGAPGAPAAPAVAKIEAGERHDPWSDMPVEVGDMARLDEAGTSAVPASGATHF